MKKKKLRIESFVKDRPRNIIADLSDTTSDDTTSEDNMTPYQINPNFTRKKCYELYILYSWEKKDLLRFGVPDKTLDKWLYEPTERGNSWKQQRELFEAKVNRAKEDKAIDEIVDIQCLSYELQKRALLERREDPTPISMVELDKLRKVGETAHSAKRLEEGKPTTIQHNLNLNKEQIKELVRDLDELDPFINYDSNKIN
jgi:hypothetical protein